jgi:hypothetical protein
MAFWALRIRGAPAIGAILPPHARLHQTAERRFALRAQPAVAAVRVQSRSRLGGEHGADASASGADFRQGGLQHTSQKQHQRQHEEQSHEDRQERAPCHPHTLRHSAVFSLPPPQRSARFLSEQRLMTRPSVSW